MVNTRNLEEAYLASVYRQLLEKQEEYQQLLQETSAYGRDSLQTMSEDIRMKKVFFIRRLSVKHICLPA